jgi:hypothetical protein
MKNWESVRLCTSEGGSVMQKRTDSVARSGHRLRRSRRPISYGGGGHAGAFLAPPRLTTRIHICIITDK